MYKYINGQYNLNIMQNVVIEHLLQERAPFFLRKFCIVSILVEDAVCVDVTSLLTLCPEGFVSKSHTVEGAKCGVIAPLVIGNGGVCTQ